MTESGVDELLGSLSAKGARRQHDYELGAVEGVGLTDVEMDSVLTLVLGHVTGAARGLVDAQEAERRTG